MLIGLVAIVSFASPSPEALAAKQADTPGAPRPTPSTILQVTEERGQCCAAGRSLCDGPGSLSTTDWPELAAFCAKARSLCPGLAAACSQTTISDDIPGAELILTGLALHPDDELTHRMNARTGAVPGEVWVILPVQVLRGAVSAPRIRVWAPLPRPGARFFRLSDGYLLLLKTIQGPDGPLYGTYSTGCASHSRGLGDAPLTDFERDLIERVQIPTYRHERLAPMCASARRLTDFVTSGGFVPDKDWLELLESASRLCGFTWCNPQYCH
jgi:hypothetical protein